MNVRIRITSEIDVHDVVARSEFATKEVEAGRSLRDFIRRSALVWIAEVDEVVACVWGVFTPSLLSDRAYLWLLTTDVAQEHQFLLVRYSQRMVEEILNRYSEIYGHCAIGQDRSIRWLRWLGAEFGEPAGLLLPFVIRKRHG